MRKNLDWEPNMHGGWKKFDVGSGQWFRYIHYPVCGGVERVLEALKVKEIKVAASWLRPMEGWSWFW